jgi:catechol 2,3-dioxygenase-like lactoylglutathione lyase family enzyme
MVPRVEQMKQQLALVAVVVRDYDEAIAFYTKRLGFDLIEDTLLPEEDKRWVVVAPPGGLGAKLLLARAVSDHQESRVGDQTGGRVGFFLYTDDFWRDYRKYQENGVAFVREPKVADYGTVAVFRDLHGNLWDLIEARA